MNKWLLLGAAGLGLLWLMKRSNAQSDTMGVINNNNSQMQNQNIIQTPSYPVPDLSRVSSIGITANGNIAGGSVLASKIQNLVGSVSGSSYMAAVGGNVYVPAAGSPAALALSDPNTVIPVFH